MSGSDWGRWLIDVVESATPEELAVWYLGCNGCILKSAGGTIVYVDPYLGGGDPPRTTRMIPVPFAPEAPSEADALVVTHEHTDHLHGPSQGPLLAETGASLLASPGCIQRVENRDWTAQYNLNDAQLATMGVGKTLTVGDIAITAREGTDPDATAGLTFIFEAAGHTVVHPGDGRPGEALEAIGREFEVDLAFVAVGSSGMIPDKQTGEPMVKHWYNDHNGCAKAARQLQTEILVPTHWDMWKGLTTDPTTVRDHTRSFAYPHRVEVLEIGDRFDLPA